MSRLDVLRDECGVSRDGSNALYIKEAAKQHGLEVKAFRKPAEGLVNRRPPFIVFWESNHFLVVEGFGRGNGSTSTTRRSAAGRSASTSSAGAIAGSPSRSSSARSFEKRGGRPGALAGLVGRLSRSRVALAFVILAGLALVIPDLAAAAFQRVFVDGILIEGHVELAPAAADRHGRDGPDAAGGRRPPAGPPDPAGDPADAGREPGIPPARPRGCPWPSSSGDSPATSSPGPGGRHESPS